MDESRTKTLGEVPPSKTAWLTVLDDAGVSTYPLPLRGRVTIGRAATDYAYQVR